MQHDDLALTYLIEEALWSATRQECGDATDVLTYLAEHATEPEMYRVCKAFAEAGMRATIRYHGGRTADRQAGELWSFDRPADLGGARLWAMRFLVAHGNADSTMTRSLFTVAWNSGEVLKYVCVLAGTVAGLINTADQAEAGQGAGR